MNIQVCDNQARNCRFKSSVELCRIAGLDNLSVGKKRVQFAAHQGTVIRVVIDNEDAGQNILPCHSPGATLSLIQ